MATRSNILAWRFPWTEEAGGLQSMGLQELDMTEHAHTQQKPIGIKTVKQVDTQHLQWDCGPKKVRRSFPAFSLTPLCLCFVLEAGIFMKGQRGRIN